MIRRVRVHIVLAGLSFACSEPPTAPPGDLSPAAAVYLNSVLNIMELHSINRFTIDWPPFRASTIEQAGTAQTTSETYNAILFAIEMLGDNHSFFRPPGATATATVAANERDGTRARPPQGHLLRNVFGYVYVPTFSGTPEEGDDLASEIQSLIETNDGAGRCGWVVDLRFNAGGNMWPMMAGVGPVLGNGLAGFFVDPDPFVEITPWGYDGGSSWLNASPVVTVDPHYALQMPNPTVAVLTDERTASSGEAVTIAFRARPDTRSFGEPTAGLSTANSGFQLSDGAFLFLTVATMADRTETPYGARVDPDVLVSSNLGSPDDIDPTTGQDPVVEAALDWLAARCGIVNSEQGITNSEGPTSPPLPRKLPV